MGDSNSLMAALFFWMKSANYHSTRRSKILRVLQEQEFEPIGSSRTIRVDIRIIAATNRDLEVAIREMRFRQDLFYRLNVFPLKVPALRARVGDVRLLVMFFLAKFNKKFGKKVDRIPAEAMQRLVNYHWPRDIS